MSVESDLTKATDRVRKHRETGGQVEAAWREAIKAAAKAEMPYRSIAELAGISHQRVAQIVNGD